MKIKMQLFFFFTSMFIDPQGAWASEIKTLGLEYEEGLPLRQTIAGGVHT